MNIERNIKKIVQILFLILYISLSAKLGSMKHGSISL